MASHLTSPNGKPSENGHLPPALSGRLATPPLPPRDPEGLDALAASSAVDWNGAAPRPHTAPADEVPSAFRSAPGRARAPLFRFSSWVRRFFGDARTGSADSTLDPDVDSPGRGVHAITRTTDYWFEREIHQIETYARSQAAEWATKGLPRHDVPRTEPFQPEQVLAAHCTQLFRDWHRRVLTRMQDAIEEASEAFGRQVAGFRNAITQLEAIRAENADLAARLVRLRVDAEREAGKPVRYERYISGWLFWPGAFVLATVEFFANFPVFRLMLPMSRALTTAAQSVADTVDDTSWLAGPRMLGHEMLMHFEATVVALVAVVVLVLLGKTLGGALRPLMAFHESEHPLARQSIRAHRRQQWMLTAASTIGIACVLGFLYLSRGSIAQLAAQRVEAEKQHIATLVADAAKLTDRVQVSQAAGRIYSAEQNKNQLADDAAYAKTVEQNNLPILGLNLALILTALVLGYSYRSEDLNDRRGEHPEIVATRERLSVLDREMYDALDRGRRAEAQAHADIARVHHLLRANPLAESQSKIRRLEGVIPLFRGENARLRGLDPANIRAFDLPSDLGLEAVERTAGFQEPAEFARLRAEFDALGAEFSRVAPAMTPALGHPVTD